MTNAREIFERHPGFVPVNTAITGGVNTSRYPRLGDIATVRVYGSKRKDSRFVTISVRLGLPAMQRLGLQQGDRFHMLVKKDAQGRIESVVLVPVGENGRRGLTLSARPGAQAATLSTSTQMDECGPLYGYPSKNEAGDVVIPVVHPEC